MGVFYFFQAGTAPGQSSPPPSALFLSEVSFNGKNGAGRII